jgi:hypothetical protein
MNYSEARAIVEALIFASPGPISQKRIAELLDLAPRTIESIVKDIQDKYRRDKSGIQIVFLPGRLFFSRRATVAPSDAALPAAIKPAGPAPTTMMSFRKTLPLLPTEPPSSGSSPLLLQ